MSGYASLLVPIGAGRRNQTVIVGAMDLAVRFGAGVTGLHVNEPCDRSRDNNSLFPVWDGVHIGPQHETSARARDAALKTDFQQRARRAGCGASDWRYALGRWVPTIVEHAAASDLLIMSQHGRNSRFGGYDAPAEIALRSARPVLVWPYEGHIRPIGERVMLAWDGSREAVAALTGALPLLVQAASVDVVVINEQRFWRDNDAGAADKNIVPYLYRHGVNAQLTKLAAGAGDTTDVLRSHVSDSGADLLCMGAYGHSRLREIVLGGTTFDMMRYMSVPTLIAA